MSKQREKLGEVIIENLEIDLDEKYITNQETIQNKNIVEIFSIKILDLNVDMESLLALGKRTSISSRIAFEAKCENYAGWTTRIFEFKCNFEVTYNQNEQVFILDEFSQYFPFESTINRLTFSQHQ